MRTYFTDVSLLVYNPDQNFLPSAEIFNYTFLDRSKERVSEPKKKTKTERTFKAKGQHKETLASHKRPCNINTHCQRQGSSNFNQQILEF